MFCAHEVSSYRYEQWDACAHLIGIHSEIGLQESPETALPKEIARREDCRICIFQSHISFRIFQTGSVTRCLLIISVFCYFISQVV